MGLYNKMQTSPRLESEGIWLEIDDTRIRLARAGGKNTKFIAAAEKIAREHKRSIDMMGEAQGRKLFGKLFAEIVVLDWLTKDKDGKLTDEGEAPAEEYTGDKYTRGISGPDGKVIEYSVDNVMKTFDDIPDLLKIIKETAEDPALFRQELLKDIEGN